MAFKKEENKNKDDFIPMRKAIAIILTVITTVVGLFGVGIFFGMKTMDTKPVLQEQNVTQIPSNEKKTPDIIQQFILSYNSRIKSEAEQGDGNSKEVIFEHLLMPTNETKIHYDNTNEYLFNWENQTGTWEISLVLNDNKDEIDIYRVMCDFNTQIFDDSLESRILRGIIIGFTEDAMVFCIDRSIDKYQFQKELADSFNVLPLLKNNVYYQLTYIYHSFSFNATRGNVVQNKLSHFSAIDKREALLYLKNGDTKSLIGFDLGDKVNYNVIKNTDEYFRGSEVHLLNNNINDNLFLFFSAEDECFSGMIVFDKGDFFGINIGTDTIDVVFDILGDPDVYEASDGTGYGSPSGSTEMPSLVTYDFEMAELILHVDNTVDNKHIIYEIFYKSKKF